MCMHRQLLDDFFDKVVCDSIPHVELAKIFDEEVAKVILFYMLLQPMGLLDICLYFRCNNLSFPAY